MSILNSQMLDGHSGEIRSIAYSPDGNLLASGSYDGTIRFWDIAKCKEIRCLSNMQRVKSIAFSPNGDRLVSSDGNTLRLWNVANGNRYWNNRHTDGVASVAFSPRRSDFCIRKY